MSAPAPDTRTLEAADGTVVRVGGHYARLRIGDYTLAQCPCGRAFRVCDLRVVASPLDADAHYLSACCPAGHRVTDLGDLYEFVTPIEAFTAELLTAASAVLHQLERGEASDADGEPRRDIAWCARTLREAIEKSVGRS